MTWEITDTCSVLAYKILSTVFSVSLPEQLGPGRVAEPLKSKRVHTHPSNADNKKPICSTNQVYTSYTRSITVAL